MYVQTLVPGAFVMMPDTGWFKHKPPNSFRRQCPRRFWVSDPEILHTCLMCPCRAFDECFSFLFFARYLIFCIFWKYLGLKGPHIYGRKRKKKNIRKRLVSDKRVCKVTRSSSQKRRGHLDFCAVKCKNPRLVSQLHGVRVYSILSDKNWLNIGPTKRVLRFFARNFAQTCLGAPERGCFRQKNS